MFKFILTYQGTQIECTDNPIGWKDLEVSYKRSEQYFGVFYEITTELGFFCKPTGGGQMLRSAFDAEGSEADVLVEIRFQSAEGHSFDVILAGRAKMDTYRVERLNDSDVTYVTVENNDLAYKLLSRDEVPVNLKSLTGLDGQALTAYTYDSNLLNLYRKLQIVSSLEENVGGTYTNQFGTGDSSMIEGYYSAGIYMPKIAIKQHDLIQINETDNQFLIAPYNYFAALQHFINQHGTLFYPAFESLETDVQKWPSTVTMAYSVNGNINCGNFAGGIGYTGAVGKFSFKIFVGETLMSAFVSGAVFSQTIVLSNSNPITANFSYSGSIVLSGMTEGTKIWPCITLDQFFAPTIPGSILYLNTIVYTINQWDFTFTCSNEYPASQVDTLLIHEAFSRISESISGQTTAFYSELLGRVNSQPFAYSSNGCDSFIAVTNGLNVRGKTEAIETTFAEMFKSIDAIANVGLGIEWQGNDWALRLEEKSYFFSNTLLLTLFGLQNVEHTVWEDEIFNEVEIGFDDWQPFAVTGLDEPLTQQNYADVIKNIKNKLELICPAIMSMNLIEIVRRFGTDQNLTQDLSQDEKQVWIALNRSTSAGVPTSLTLPEKDENFPTITNLIEPTTAMNLRYSPKRNLLRHMSRIADGLIKVSALLRYAGGEGNQAMITQMTADSCPGDYTGASLTEAANISWNDTNIRNNTPLFYPELYSFRHPLSYTQYKAIQADPKGYIRGQCADGTFIEGYVHILQYTPEQGIADFVLIRKFNG